MPQIFTDRLLLREFCDDDLEALAAIYGDYELMKDLPMGPLNSQKTAEALESFKKEWAKNKFGVWAIMHIKSKRLIGHCGLQKLGATDDIEVFYLIDKPYHNQGFATEAAFGALKWGFRNLNLDRIAAIAKPENKASLRVLEKLGFEFERYALFYGLIVKLHYLSRGAFNAKFPEIKELP